MNTRFAFMLLLLAAVATRLVLHVPNMNPIDGLCIVALGLFSWPVAMLFMLMAFGISDFALTFLAHASFGSWAFFTYSGHIVALWASKKIYTKDPHRVASCGALFVVLYWLWTNFGTFLCSGMYNPLSLSSLGLCYVAALPFLSYSLLGMMLTLLLISQMQLGYTYFITAVRKKMRSL